MIKMDETVHEVLLMGTLHITVFDHTLARAQRELTKEEIVLVNERYKARIKKEFKKADEIRNTLKTRDITLEDRRE